MKFLQYISIKTRLLIIFIILLTLLIILAFYSVYELNEITTLADTIYNHPLNVSNAASKIKNNITSMDGYMKDIMLVKADIELYNLIDHIRIKEDELFRNLDLIKGKILGYQGKALEETARELILNWRPIREKIIRHIEEGDFETALAMHNEYEDSYVVLLEQKSDELYLYARNKADGFITDAYHVEKNAGRNMIIIIVGAFLIILICSLIVSKSILDPIIYLKSLMDTIVKTNELKTADLKGKNEVVEMSNYFNVLIEILKDQLWYRKGLNALTYKLTGNLPLDDLTSRAVSYIADYLHAGSGALYLYNEEDETCNLTATYAYVKRDYLANKFARGEGIIGQVAREKKAILLKNLNKKQAEIQSGTTSVVPTNLIAYPMIYENTLYGVIEISTLTEITEIQLEFIKNAGATISTFIASSLQDIKINNLLKSLQHNNQELETQSEELRVVNEQIEKKSSQLQKQKEEIEEKNTILESKSREIEQKAKQLELAGKYKSEFLSSMSHELRTPLNSLLILSKDLSKNKEGNLTDDQKESLNVIHKSGIDLLNLINDVLDLSKIESGKYDIFPEKISINTLIKDLNATFKSIAGEKKLEFIIEHDQDLPAMITTDEKMLNQILKNLVSNALKFTHEGSVRLEIKHNVSYTTETDESAYISFSVIDTGIGIPDNKKDIIFHPFEQGDRSITREFGGTGLGLSISKKLAEVLGGYLTMDSTVDKGSTFTFYLPYTSPVKTRPPQSPRPSPEQPSSMTPEHIVQNVWDDRSYIEPGDKIVLIIEDDTGFQKIVADIARKKGFKVLTATNGVTGIDIAINYIPHAILLDIMLPGLSGISVLERLKEDARTRHIPVHMMSMLDEKQRLLSKGAINYLKKPVTREDLEDAFENINTFISLDYKHLLLVEDDTDLQMNISKLLGNGDLKITSAGTAKEARALIEKNDYQCMILDLGLPDLSGFELLDILKNENRLTFPVIIYSGKELTKEEEQKLQHYADSIIIKGVASQERLLDETTLFLHRVESNLPEEKQAMIRQIYDYDTILHDKKILIVDDDMRNLFSLSKVLTDKGVKVLKADNGSDALGIINKEDVDLILMDIMMPVMDGYETIKRIRQSEHNNKSVPIIALTAKAMKDDYKKCIEAGANDYLSKPIDIDKLFSIIRVWLFK